MKNDDLILGGDLNFSLGTTESWGPRVCPGSLSDYFNHILREKGLIDIAPTNLCPSWRNKTVGEDYIANGSILEDSCIITRSLWRLSEVHINQPAPSNLIQTG